VRTSTVEVSSSTHTRDSTQLPPHATPGCPDRPRSTWVARARRTRLGRGQSAQSQPGCPAPNAPLGPAVQHQAPAPSARRLDGWPLTYEPQDPGLKDHPRDSGRRFRAGAYARPRSFTYLCALLELASLRTACARARDAPTRLLYGS